jgi:hypothetical protein
MFLASPKTALDDIDDEIVGFTQNGGWQKLENLWPLMIDMNSIGRRLQDWMDTVQIVFDNLKVSLSVLHRDGL